MPYSLENRLIIGIASSALFDLAASDEVFRNEGEEAYRTYQEENIDNPLTPGRRLSLYQEAIVTQ